MWCFEVLFVYVCSSQSTKIKRILKNAFTIFTMTSQIIFDAVHCQEHK
jgi:hypothetical protein